MEHLRVYAEFWFTNGNMLTVYKGFNPLSKKAEYTVCLFDLDRLEDKTIFAAGTYKEAKAYFDRFKACPV